MKTQEAKRSALAMHISECVKNLEPRQLGEIAREAGFTSSDTLKFLMEGKMKLPLDKVEKLAKALHTDEDNLRHLAQGEWFSSNALQVSAHTSGEPAKDTRVINGMRLPWDGAITDNERAWIEFLRIICNNEVPAPSSSAVTSLRELIDSLGYRSI